MNIPMSGTVRLSDVMTHGRMDAGFLLALTHLKSATETLRDRYDVGQAVALLDSLSLADKAPMSILMRGSGTRSMTTKDATELSREYPHLALALIANDAASAIERIREEIARSEAAMSALIELADDTRSDADQDDDVDGTGEAA
jgi:hypothetical protein